LLIATHPSIRLNRKPQILVGELAWLLLPVLYAMWAGWSHRNLFYIKPAAFVLVNDTLFIPELSAKRFLSRCAAWSILRCSEARPFK